MSADLDLQVDSGIGRVLKESAFVVPSTRVRAEVLPYGRVWFHEVKHVGGRAQLQQSGDGLVHSIHDGNGVTRRFRSIAAAVLPLPARSAFINAELVASDADGNANF